MNSICTDLITLAKYIGGKLSEVERQEVEAHLSVCRHCRSDVVSATLLLRDEGVEKQDPRISAEIASAVWEKFRQQITRFYEWVIPSCPLALPAMRSGKVQALHQIRFSKQFDDISLDFRAEKHQDSAIAFHIGIRDSNIKSLRIILRKENGKILFSKPLTDDICQNLPYGIYHLNVISQSQEKGNMTFEVNHAGITEG